EGRVRTREELLKKVWDYPIGSGTRTIETHVKRLRGQLGGAGGFVEAVRLGGFRLPESGEDARLAGGARPRRAGRTHEPAQHAGAQAALDGAHPSQAEAAQERVEDHRARQDDVGAARLEQAAPPGGTERRQLLDGARHLFAGGERPLAAGGELDERARGARAA